MHFVPFIAAARVRGALSTYSVRFVDRSLGAAIRSTKCTLRVTSLNAGVRGRRETAWGRGETEAPRPQNRIMTLPSTRTSGPSPVTLTPNETAFSSVSLLSGSMPFLIVFR